MTISSVTASGVRMQWSANWPQVTALTYSCASSAVAKVSVAPSPSALSRLNCTGSTTTTFFAPAYRAPCTALLPTPPAPKTTTVSPGLTPAAYTAEPHPVGTPQPTRHAISNGMSSSSGTTAHSETTAYSENVPSEQNPP